MRRRSDMLAGVNRAGVDFAATFRWVFVAAAAFLCDRPALP